MGWFRIGHNVRDFLQVLHVAPLVSRNWPANEPFTSRVLGFIQVRRYVDYTRLLQRMKVTAAEFQLFIGFDLLCTPSGYLRDSNPSVLNDGLAIQSGL